MQNPFETEERVAFRDSLAKLIASDVTPYVDAWDEKGEIPWALHEKFGEMGVFGFGVDEAYGGLGFDDMFMRAAFSEEIGKCGANGVWAALNGRTISIMPIQELATEDIKMEVLPDVVGGRKSSSLAITEPSGGSDVARLKTTAKKDGGDYILNGSKTFITSAMDSEYFVVGARTGGPGIKGISLFFVRHDDPGFSRIPLERKMGWWCSNQATLFFDDCRVPASRMLGEENQGFISIMHNFNPERISLAATALGMAKLCLQESINWAQDRQTFGQPLMQHQVIRHKIADMSARIDACDAYMNQVCWMANENKPGIAGDIAKLKFTTTKMLEFVASEAMQILGGAGYLRGNVVERAYREVKVLAIGGGSEEIMRDLAVRQMGL